jgi:hypothetical protein
MSARDKGRRLLAWIIIVPMIILAIALGVWGVIDSTQKPPVYSCAVDTATIGPQTVDLCSLVPQGVRERSNVVVTTGMAKYAGIINNKDVHITFYNVLTAADQIDTIVKTPGPIRFFAKFGFYWGYLGGIASVPVFYGFLLITKKMIQKRRTSPRRQTEFVRPEDDDSDVMPMKKLDLKVNSI